MPITQRVDKEKGILIVTRSGKIETHDEEKALQERDKDHFVLPGLAVLVDCTGVDPPDKTEVVLYLASNAAHLAQKLKCGPMAIVVSTDVMYGMARMYQALTELDHPETEIFRTTEDALAWLESRRQIPDKPTVMSS